MPLHMRLPKLKGFKNRFRTEYQVVNLDRIAALFPQGGTDRRRRAGRRGRWSATTAWSRCSATATSASPLARHRARVLRLAPRRRSPPPAAPPPSSSAALARAPGRRSRRRTGRPGASGPAVTVDRGRAGVRLLQSPHARPQRARRPCPPTLPRRLAGPSAGAHDPSVPRTDGRQEEPCSPPSVGPSRRPTCAGRSCSRWSSSAIYRLGLVRPRPRRLLRRDPDAASTQVEGDSLYGLVNLFSGGALLQLSRLRARDHAVHHGVDHPAAARRGHPAAGGRSRRRASPARPKITQYTRYLTVALAVLQSTGIVALARSGQLFPNCSERDHPGRLAVPDPRPGHHDDRRHRRDHVARRAHHRPRRRQRHVRADLHLDHLARSRRRPCRLYQQRQRPVRGRRRSRCSRWSSSRSSSSSSRPSAASRCSTPSA